MCSNVNVEKYNESKAALPIAKSVPGSQSSLFRFGSIPLSNFKTSKYAYRLSMYHYFLSVTGVIG